MLGARSLAMGLNRDPDEIMRRRDAMHTEQSADVRERQREDRVLDLHERREATRKSDDSGHVCLCSDRPPAIRSIACGSAGLINAKPSRQPPGDPGRLTIKVCP